MSGEIENGAARANHTSGPWDVGDLDQAGQRIVRQQHIEICTCWHHSVGSIEREMEANARLIAAAPELLAELKAVREQCLFDDDDGIGVSEDVVIPSDMFDRICAAINKAEGRS